jgi:hypothetical protein
MCFVMNLSSSKFNDENELKSFTRAFVQERINSLKQDVSHCLKGAATFPAILYSMSTIYLLGELYNTSTDYNTTGSSLKYMKEMMGYDEIQRNLLMKLFRHKLVHLAAPRPVAIYPPKSRLSISITGLEYIMYH